MKIDQELKLIKKDCEKWKRIVVNRDNIIKSLKLKLQNQDIKDMESTITSYKKYYNSEINKRSELINKKNEELGEYYRNKDSVNLAWSTMKESNEKLVLELNNIMTKTFQLPTMVNGAKNKYKWFIKLRKELVELYGEK